VHLVRFTWKGMSYSAELVLCPPRSRTVSDASLVLQCRR
jgi:hypothetical protein